MTPERWKKLKPILAEALPLTPRARTVFLKQACGGDAALLVEAEALLVLEDANPLDRSAHSIVVDDSSDAPSLVGKQIGRYRLVSELGAGGMGTVYLAERSDGAFEQKVALKLIKRGMDSDAILRRFMNERQILASLEHPNIARLMDGGTTADALPFFVMEYVEGKTIVDFVTSEDLDLKAMLRLFRQVCSAVTYAHQNLVVHRDLKPSNILVGKDGVPKLLDFGIATLLKSETSDGASTRNFIFTPEYASPEQVRSEKLTTASDIYSLGVILYELMCGHRPYDTGNKNISDVIRAICETEPERPSSVVSRPSAGPNDTGQNKESTREDRRRKPHALRGDLDTIILKALRKEPERRYSSVEQFSDDIRRHLEGLPVLAIKDTWRYRTSKFIHRNRLAVAAAGVILLTLIGGISATLYLANVARQERVRAERRFNDVRQLANSFLFEFHDAIENLPGSTPARKLVVSRAVEYLDKLVAESADDPDLQRELGAAYEKIGKIQGNSYFPNLGDTDGAMKSYGRSLEIRQVLADANPSNREMQYDLAISHRGVGDMFYTVNDLQGGLASYERSLAILDRLAADEPANLKYRSSLVDILSRRGDILGMEGYPNLGDTFGALETYRRVAALAADLVRADESKEEYKGDYATRLFYLGLLQTATGDSAGAIASGQRAVTMLESLVAANPDNAAFRTRLMAAFSSMRPSLLDEGRTTEAIENARKVLKTLEDQNAADPKNIHLRRSLDVSYSSLGECLMQAGDARGAMENYRHSLVIAEELATADPKNAEHRRDVSLSQRLLAEAQMTTGDPAGALANLLRAVSSIEADMAADAPDLKSKQDLALALYETGKAQGAKGDRPGSVDSFRRALRLGEEYLLKNPVNVRFRTRHALAYFEAGKAYSALGQKHTGAESSALMVESCSSLRQSLAIFSELQQAGTLGVIYSNRPAMVSAELGRCG